MKLNKLWASALALLALASCSKDLEPSANTVEPAPLQTKTVSISLTASPDADALRVLYDMNGMDNGAVGPFKWSDKNKQIKIRVGVRRGTGDAIIQDLIFNKDRNNRAYYEGPVTIPTDGSGDYSIAGALLSEVGAGAKTFLRTSYSAESPQVLKDTKEGMWLDANHTLLTPSSDGILDINVPYLTGWQPLEVDSDTNKAKHTTLNFEPQGTVLRIRIKNETSKPQTFHRIKFASNNLANSGYYYFNLETNDDAQLDWLANNRETFIFSIPSGVVVPAKTSTNASYSPWFYTWVLPRTISFTPLTTASLSQGTSDTDNPFKVVFKTRQRLPSGSVPLTLTYKDGGLDASFDSPMDLGGDFGDTNGSTQPVKLAIDYLAPHVLNAAGTGFVDSYTTTFGSEVSDEQRVGFFYGPDALRRFSTPFAIPEGSTHLYSMLTRDEMVSIIPPMLDGSGVGVDKFEKGRKTYNLHETSVKIGAFTRDYLSDYYVTADGGTFYGLRFKNSENCTAFRYRIQEISGSQVMKIECILLGAGNALKLDDIAQDSYWTQNAFSSYTLPLYGTQVKGTHTSVLQVNQTCYYLTSTSFDKTAVYTADIYRYFGGLSKGLWTGADVTGSRIDRNYPILLMKRN